MQKASPRSFLTRFTIRRGRSKYLQNRRKKRFKEAFPSVFSTDYTNEKNGNRTERGIYDLCTGNEQSWEALWQALGVAQLYIADPTGTHCRIDWTERGRQNNLVASGGG